MNQNPYPSEYRLSPDNQAVAIRLAATLADRQGTPWFCSNGSRLSDAQVVDWQPLRAMSLSECLEQDALRRALD